MDLAINGAGFFQVTDGESAPSYIRNGQFKVDRDGYIVNNGGMRLMGYPANAARRDPARPGAGRCSCPPAASSPAPTATIQLEMNLDSRRAITAAGVGRGGRLQRRRHLQQRDLADGVRRQGPGSGADLLLPEVGHRHLERLRHRQRHSRSAAPTPHPMPIATHHLPGRRQRTAVADRRESSSTSRRPRTRRAPRRCAITGLSMLDIGRRDAVRLALRRHRPAAGRLRAGR